MDDVLNGTLTPAYLEECVRAGFDVNAGAPDRWGLTALHIAAIHAHPACIALLVAAGANVNARAASESGLTPLHSAANGHRETLGCLVALLAAGADPNLAYEGKQREGHFFALHQGTTAVHLAPLSDHSNDGVVMRELLRAGGDPGRVTSRGASPLMFLAAVSYDAAGGIKTLRDACRDTGVPLDIEYQIPVNSATALQLAAYMSQPATVAGCDM